MIQYRVTMGSSPAAIDSIMCGTMGGGDWGARGAMPPPPPHFFWDTVCKKDRDTLIEQSGSGYSNKVVTVFREAV